MLIKSSIIGDAAQDIFVRAGGLLTVSADATKNVALGSLTVLGSVEHTQVLAGYGTDNAQINGGVQIGPVKVGGDWSKSSISAGFNPGGDGVFGTSDDTRIGADPASIIGSIASIQIKGVIIGSGSSGDHYGFVAGQIGNFTTGRFKAPLAKGGMPDVIEVGGFTGDVTVREIV